MVQLVSQDPLAVLAHPVLQVILANKAILVTKVPLEYKDLKDTLVTEEAPDQQAPLVLLEPQGTLVHLVLKVHKVFLVDQELLVTQATQVLQEPLVTLVHKVSLEIKVCGKIYAPLKVNT